MGYSPSERSLRSEYDVIQAALFDYRQTPLDWLTATGKKTTSLKFDLPGIAKYVLKVAYEFI